MEREIRQVSVLEYHLLCLFTLCLSGPVFSLNMAGKHFVVLNTAKAAIDLIGA